jgi:hypothetical protein
MGKKGDSTNDSTLRWDDEDNRPTTPLGKISIEAIMPEATCAWMHRPTSAIGGKADMARTCQYVR